MRRFAFFTFACWLFSAPALADVISFEEELCERKSVGDACAGYGVSGTCRLGVCKRVDYGVDAGGRPGFAEYECLVCETSGGGEAAGGCSANDASAELGAAGIGLALALAAFALRRAQIRRRRPTKSM